MTISEVRSKLTSSLEHLKLNLSSIRAGRATTSLVEEIQVDAYGDKLMVKEVASLATPDASMIVISPWDKGLIKEIDRAIRMQNLGLNPVPDSQVLKVPIPSLTEERRKEFTKLVTERCEEAKNSMRNVRQDAMKALDKAFADKTLTEDEKFTQKDEIEKVVKEFLSKAEELSEAKKKDLMTV